MIHGHDAHPTCRQAGAVSIRVCPRKERNRKASVSWRGHSGSRPIPGKDGTTHSGKPVEQAHDSLGGYGQVRAPKLSLQTACKRGHLEFEIPCDTLGGNEAFFVRHSWGETGQPCDTLGGKRPLSVRHSWGKQTNFHDILGAFFDLMCDILGGNCSKIHDTLGGKRLFFATYLGEKWGKTSCSTWACFSLDVDSSIFLLLLKQRKSSIKACSVRHATLHAPETPWRVNPGGTT